MVFFADVLFFAVALVLLVKGAEWVTRYASKLVAHWGISEFAIGATVVAVATSLPEIFVALVSGVSNLTIPGSVDIASGTVIGSNIANIGLVLGLAVLLSPIGRDTQEIQQEHFMLILSFLLAYFLIGGIGLAGGIALLGLTFVYTFYLTGRTRTYNPFTLLKGAYYKLTVRESLRDLLYSLVGGLALAGGAILMVNSVTGISNSLAIPQFLIALIAVAIGTSLPELSASIYAAVKGMKSLSIGNIIGSNIINICALGMTAIITPIATTPRMFLVDIPVMLLLALLLLAFMKINRGFPRITGVIFILIYAGFVALQLI